MSSEHVYTGVIRWLLYAALVFMAAMLVVYVPSSGPKVFQELSDAMAGKLREWFPHSELECLVMYPIYFTNIIVIVGLAAALPMIVRESKAAAIVAVAVLALLVLMTLGLVRG